ncbi:MAG TPA: hypothetical protein VF989_02220 [Polyangiaceae bacterium]
MAERSIEPASTFSAPGYLIELEAAHDALADGVRALSAPAELGVDVTSALPPLTDVYRDIYRAYADGRDPFEHIRAAVAHADRAAANLEPVAGESPHAQHCIEQLGECKKHLASAEARLSPALVPPAVPPGDLVASIELPRVHRIARDVAVRRIDVAPAPLPEVTRPPPAIASPKTLEELLAAVEELRARAAPAEAKAPSQVTPAQTTGNESPPGFAADPLPALAPFDWTLERARICFEDVVMLCSQRTPQLGEAWQQAEFLERRLLANVDALCALGGTALSALEPFVLASPAPDPWQLFGLAFVAGCVEGRDLLAAAERVLEDHAQDPEFVQAMADALKLVTHPFVPFIVRRWLESTSPLRRALAVDVLGYRGFATHEELDRASQDDPTVAVKALPHFALGPPQRVREVLDDLLHRNDDALVPALWQALVLSGHPQASAVLGAALGGPRAADAATLLAVGGEKRDAEDISKLCRSAPSAGLAAGLGWAGDASAPPLLIALLARDDAELKAAAAGALERITGAELYEEVEVPPEVVMEPDVPEPALGDAGPELATELSDPRDAPSDGSPDTVELPAQGVETWKRWWFEHQGEFMAGQRYRRGKPYSPLVVLDELENGRVTPAERRLLQMELVVRTGSAVRCEPHDFVAAQRASIAAWRGLAERASGRAGVWQRPVRR